MCFGYVTKESYLCIMENWKDIEGWEGFYQISDKGRVKSLSRLSKANRKLKEKIMKLATQRGGYLAVTLRDGEYIVTKTVHRLVGKAFIVNPDNLPEINHKDGIKSNNCKENLEWCTKQDNMSHAISSGLISQFGENNPNWKGGHSATYKKRVNSNL